MRTKIYFVAILFALAISLRATTPLRGPERLRELVVFPDISLNFNFGINFQGNDWVINENENLPDEISRAREELKLQPDDIKKLLRLGNLLDSDDQTNESASYYQKAEQLCREKISENPRDGLTLMDLGEALNELGKSDEAENFYRKATLVSSNDWRCWVELGNFLPGKYFSAMFPENLRGQILPSQVPPQEVLDCLPSPDALTKSEAALAEACRCFDHAIALAPTEPRIFSQRAGYMSMSNYENCFFRYYRKNEQISSEEWLAAFFSKETISNLQKAADLSPNNYEYISLAAYFEWNRAAIESKSTNFSSEMLPDATRKSIHSAMTRLENLSENSDKKIAAAALENLGFLNITFENSSLAKDDFRRAVSLDPTREQSWDMWLATLFDTASPDEWLKVCQARLKIKDSARNHLLLSKVFVYMEKWSEASQQAEMAQQQETNNVIAPLMLTAIALKQSSQTNYLSIAKTNIEHASVIVKKMPIDDEKEKRGRELLLDITIFYALTGQPEIARDYAKEILKHLPNDETAKAILEATN